MIQRLGFWSCKSCNHENDGDKLVCDICGEHLEYGKEEFYPYSKIDGMEGRILTHDEMHENPHWNCVACNAMNYDKDKVCHFCFTDRSVYTNAAIHNESDVVKIGRTYADVEKEMEIPAGNPNRDFSKEPSPLKIIDLRNVIGFLGALLGIALLGVFFWWLFTPKELALQSIYAVATSDRYETVQRHGSGWDRHSGAYNVTSIEKFHHNDKVIDHYEDVKYPVSKTRKVGQDCVNRSRQVANGERTVGSRKENLGNGRFRDVPIKEKVYRMETYKDCRDIMESYTVMETRSEPVYRDVPIYRPYYTYDYDEDVVVESVKCRYTDKNVKPCREGGRWKTDIDYVFVFMDGKDRLEKDVDFNRYMSAEIGKVYKVGTFSVE